MSRLQRFSWAVFFLALTGAAAEPALAQQSQGRAQMEQRIRQRFLENAKERLGLDQTQARDLAQVLEEARLERAAIAAETRALRSRVRGALRRAGGQPLSDAEGADFLEELRALSDRERDLVIREQEALGEFMGPGQIVLFYQLRDQLNQRIREIRARRGNGPG